MPYIEGVKREEIDKLVMQTIDRRFDSEGETLTINYFANDKSGFPYYLVQLFNQLVYFKIQISVSGLVAFVVKLLNDVYGANYIEALGTLTVIKHEYSRRFKPTDIYILMVVIDKIETTYYTYTVAPKKDKEKVENGDVF